MTTTHVYQIYLRAEIERVWAALTDPALTRAYFHGTAFTEPPRQGWGYRTTRLDGSPAVEGTTLVLDPPHRLVQTWHIRYDAALEAEPPGRVEWALSRAGDGLTHLRLTHEELALSPLTWAHVKDGWVWILDGLKTLLETGTALPAVSSAVSDSAAPHVVAESIAADWHRAQAVEANNVAWALLDGVRDGSARAEELLRGAYAAAYHWQRARGATPANEARASYLLAKAWVAAGRGTLGLEYADRTLAQCREHDLADFDLAYAHEARARSLAVLGRADESAAEWAAAWAVPIADAEDRAIVEADFADDASR